MPIRLRTNKNEKIFFNNQQLCFVPLAFAPQKPCAKTQPYIAPFGSIHTFEYFTMFVIISVKREKNAFYNVFVFL